MTINVKGLFETLQYKANNIDSSTSTAEILDTLKAIKLADGNTIISYDSDGAFPDASTTNIKLGYNKQTGKIKFNNGTWDTLTGSLDGTVSSGYSFQGEISGYTSGGKSPANVNVIDKFPFSTDANATDVGDLTVVQRDAVGQSSSTHGYSSGGLPSILVATIEKFPFAVDENAVDTTYDLTVARYSMAGQSSSDNGYASGGASPSFSPVYLNIIDKFPFATDANAIDVGDLTVTRTVNTGQSSTDYGYTSGGFYSPAHPAGINNIDKFPFSTDANATDVGDLVTGNRNSAGQNSSTHGYHSGGVNPWRTTIDKFSFSTDGNATDVGDLTDARGVNAGQSSTDYGYTSAGYNPIYNPIYINIIDKFPFSVDANATDVGDVTVARYNASSQQV